jgi:hypothetical protein
MQEWSDLRSRGNSFHRHHFHEEASSGAARRRVKERRQLQATELVRIIEHVEGHYDLEYVEFGIVYKWQPGSVVVECICGERLTLTRSGTSCGECGADYTSVAREVLSAGRRPKGDKTTHTWRYWHPSGRAGIPCQTHEKRSE